jgi:peptidyl-prolyl cis-trans isomerase C
MKKSFIFTSLLAAALLMLAYGCSKEKTATRPPDNSPVLAEVNGEPITENTFRAETKTLPPQVQQMLSDQETRKKFLDEVINKELLVQQARKEGLENDPDYKKVMDQTSFNLLLQLYVSREVFDKAKVTDEEVKEYFEKNKQNLGSVRISHIQVASPEEAEQVLAKYKAGTPFTKLVKEYSQDTSTKDKGGDLGYVNWAQFGSPVLRDAAFNTPMGNVSNVIRSSFAYHIIKVTDKKPATDADFDKIKGSLKQYLLDKRREELFNKKVEELSATAKITKNEATLKEMSFAGETGENTGKTPETPAPAKTETPAKAK